MTCQGYPDVRRLASASADCNGVTSLPVLTDQRPRRASAWQRMSADSWWLRSAEVVQSGSRASEGCALPCEIPHGVGQRPEPQCASSPQHICRDARLQLPRISVSICALCPGPRLGSRHAHACQHAGLCCVCITADESAPLLKLRTEPAHLSLLGLSFLGIRFLQCQGRLLRCHAPLLHVHLDMLASHLVSLH